MTVCVLVIGLLLTLLRSLGPAYTLSDMHADTATGAGTGRGAEADTGAEAGVDAGAGKDSD